MTITKILTSLPVIPQARSYSDFAIKFIHITNQLSASVLTTKVINSVFLSPYIKFTFKYIIVFTQFGDCAFSGSPSSDGSTAISNGSTNLILEELS